MNCVAEACSLGQAYAATREIAGKLHGRRKKMLVTILVTCVSEFRKIVVVQVPEKTLKLRLARKTISDFD